MCWGESKEPLPLGQAEEVSLGQGCIRNGVQLWATVELGRPMAGRYPPLRHTLRALLGIEKVLEWSDPESTCRCTESGAPSHPAHTLNDGPMWSPRAHPPGIGTLVKRPVRKPFPTLQQMKTLQSSGFYLPNISPHRYQGRVTSEGTQG